MMIVPDHYTNLPANAPGRRRADIHSMNAVPFALWNGRERDGVEAFSEDAVLAGKYAARPVSHLDLMAVLGVSRAGMVKAQFS
jgi:2,3-bisphosphoglycerate-independent phosphoglycerate mutase